MDRSKFYGGMLESVNTKTHGVGGHLPSTSSPLLQSPAILVPDGTASHLLPLQWRRDHVTITLTAMSMYVGIDMLWPGRSLHLSG